MRSRRFALLPVCLVLIAAGPAAAQGNAELTVVINRAPLARATDNPLRLDPNRPAEMQVTVTNHSRAALEARAIRLEGRVVGLTFFSYDTSVLMQVGPGATQTRVFTLDLRGLNGQANGLLPASVQLLDQNRRRLASQSFVADVRGSMRSLYGFFGLTVLVLTVLAFVGALTDLARHRLPSNRALRGLRFAPLGVGVGLILAFTLSSLRVWAPSRGRVLGIVFVVTAVSFVLGYLTPTPGGDRLPIGS